MASSLDGFVPAGRVFASDSGMVWDKTIFDGRFQVVRFPDDLQTCFWVYDVDKRNHYIFTLPRDLTDGILALIELGEHTDNLPCDAGEKFGDLFAATCMALATNDE